MTAQSSYILQVMKDEHESLSNTLKRLLSLIQGILPNEFKNKDLDELIFLYCYFQKRLEFHFDVEENLGVLQDIKKHHMDLYQEVMALEFDHKRLSADLGSAYGVLVNTDFNNRESIIHFENQLKEFVEKLKEHEERETSLAIRAVTTDLGSMD